MEQTAHNQFIKKLGDICDFQGGAQPPKSAWKKTPCDGYIRMLQIRDFTQSRHVQEEFVKIDKKLRTCKETDILLGRYGASVGKVLTGLSGAYNVAIMKTIPDTDVVLPNYLKHYFLSDSFQKMLQKVCVTRSAQAGFSKEDIHDFPIYVPSIAEQERIVKKLDDVMYKIDCMKANTEFTLSATKDLFESTLSNVFKNNTNNWREETLTNVINKVKYTTKIKSKMYLKEGLFPIVSQEENFISGYWNDSKDLFRVKNPVVIFGDHTKVAKYIDFDFILGADGVKILDPKPFINPRFLYYWVKYVPLRNLGYARHFKLLSQKTISFPSLEEQAQIVKVLDKLQDKLKQYEEICKNKLKLLEDLKQSVLKQAFAGEL